LKSTRAETEAQLQPGEQMAISAWREVGRGATSSLVTNDTDFYAAVDFKAKGDLVGLYAISDELARTAS
jgi:hypothetical protein